MGRDTAVGRRAGRFDPADLDRARLLAAERLEEARSELESLQGQLALAPRWRPSRGLGAQCREALLLIDRMQQRMRNKLVVALIGPTGAGKSTLLNALAGVDGLSPTGVDRPTTSEVVVFSRDRDDATPLLERLGHERVTVVSSPAALALEHVILVDTPDINSSMLAEHRPIVEAVIGQADLLVCVFNVENPKARDNADFLAPFVAGFPSQHVLAVLNHSDRQDEAELRDDIKPDFEQYLRDSWDRPPAGVFAISARRHLRRPGWPDGARPRHDFDEYGELKEMLFGSLNRASVVLDARIERARHLVTAARRAVLERAGAQRDTLTDARRRIRALHGEALTASAGALGKATTTLGAGTDALYYQRLAASWWGPVGWLVGIWARLLIVGAGFVNILRFGNPLRQLWGTLTSLARFKQTRAAIDEAEQGVGVDVAALRYRDVYERAWPEVAEELVSAGFDPAVRDPAVVVPDSEQLDRRLASGWNEALEQRLDTAASRLSGWWLQLVLNAIVLLPAGVVAADAVVSFVRGRLLTGDYFRHALITLLLLWLLAFVVFQMAARLTGGRRLLQATLDDLLESLKGTSDAGRGDALLEEVETVRRLAG